MQKNLASSGGVLRCLRVGKSASDRKDIFSHLTNTEMLISRQLATAKMLISLQKQRNVDFTRTRKLEDVDFTLNTAKCGFHKDRLTQRC